MIIYFNMIYMNLLTVKIVNIFTLQLMYWTNFGAKFSSYRTKVIPNAEITHFQMAIINIHPSGHMTSK